MNRRVWVFDNMDEHLGGHFAQVNHRLLNRREGWIHQRGEGGIIIAGHGYILRRTPPRLRQCFDRADGHQIARGKLPEPASIALAALSGVCYERNQIAQAHQLLTRATEVDPNPLGSNMRVTCAIQRAKIQWAQGNGEAAQATLQAAREWHVKHPSSLWLDQDLIAYQALFCLRQGDCAGAERLLSEVEDTEAHALSALVQAEILLEQKQAAAVESLLSRLITKYPHGLYRVPILGACVMLALALFEQHKVSHARQVMAEAVRLAGPESFIRPFLDQRIPKCAPAHASAALREALSRDPILCQRSPAHVGTRQWSAGTSTQG